MNGTSNSIQLKLVKASGKVGKKQKFWQRNKSDLQKIASFVKSKTKNFIKYSIFDYVIINGTVSPM